MYARVSSDKQDVENSMDRQREACENWAARNGHQFLGEPYVYKDEAKSGSSMLARSGLQDLLDVLRGRGDLPFDAVLVDDDSRLDRGGNLVEIAKTFQARGVRLIPVDTGRDLTSESERLGAHMKSGMNEQYLLDLSRRTRNGIEAKVKKGFHGGGKVFGYSLVPEWPAGIPAEKRERENRTGTRVEVNEGEAKIVRRIFDQYIAGAGLREIAKGLNADGVRSSRGKPTWDPSGIRVLLLNPKYIGDWSWKRSRWQKRPETLMSETERTRVRFTGEDQWQRIPLPESKWVESLQPHLRIVTEATWEAVQKRFAGRVRDKKGSVGSNRRSRSPIASLLRCECGGGIASWSSAPKKGDGKAHRYTRLYCGRHKNRGPEVCGNSVMFRIEDVAGPLLAYVKDVLLDPARVQNAVDLVNAKVREAASADATRVKRQGLEMEIARLDAEVGRLMDLAITVDAPEHARTKLHERATRLKEARRELAELATPGPVRLLPTMSGEALRAQLDRIWQDINDPDLDTDKARLGLEQLFGEILVAPLDDDWEKGWLLKLKTRPWALVLPRDEVVSTFGCGGRI